MESSVAAAGSRQPYSRGSDSGRPVCPAPPGYPSRADFRPQGGAARHVELLFYATKASGTVGVAGYTGFAPSLEGDLMSVALNIELESEADGRWIAEVVELPGVLAYGATQDEAIAHVQALALRVIADRLEHDEAGREFLNITFAAA